jgi:hypothetical protein
MKAKAYGEIVVAMSAEDLAREIADPRKLRFAATRSGWRRVEMAWAPFDAMNRQAKIAIFGITPGRTQMENALKVYQHERQRGATHREAAIIGKRQGAFSGEMRLTLIRILNEVGIPDYLGISGSSTLWGIDAEKVHFSSALRWPVFVEVKDKDGEHRMENYTGSTPAVTSLPVFKETLKGVLAPELAGLPENCLIAPLGVAATKAVLFAADHLPALDRDRILIGLPHPAGSARDVSSQFLGNPANPKRKSPLNPEYRETALRLRAQVLRLADAREPVKPNDQDFGLSPS